MFRRSIVLAAALVALAAGSSAARPVAAGPPPACSSSCRAAYDAIAKALPRDRGNVLLKALLHTPGFDWTLLARSLHVPTARQIDEEFRA